MNPPSPASSTFYITGGTMPSDAPSYLKRAADQELFKALVASEFCYVLTSRQMGKSSLVSHARTTLREAGRRVVTLDLQKLGFNLSVDQWYVGLLDQLSRALDLEDEIDDYLADHKELPAHYRWTESLARVVLPQIQEPVVIFVDEIDLVRSLPFSASEFFVGIRELHNRRAEDPELKRLTFCLLGVATPTDLIADTQITPFNIGTRIHLHDFTEAESLPLAGGIGDNRDGIALVRRTHYWSGGQPYLIQCLCKAIAADNSVRTIADVDRLCSERFLSKNARDQDANLVFVRDRLLNPRDTLRQRLEIYREVWKGRRLRYDDRNPVMSQVALSGAVAVDDEGCMCVKNPIYRDLFNQRWIASHLEVDYVKLIKKAALWLLYALLVVPAPLAYFAYQAQKDAETRAKEALVSQQMLQVQVKLGEKENAQQKEVTKALNAEKTKLQATQSELSKQLATAMSAAAEAEHKQKSLDSAFIELVKGEVEDKAARKDAYGLALVRAKVLSLGDDLRKMYQDSPKLPSVPAALIPAKVVHTDAADEVHFFGDDQQLLIGHYGPEVAKRDQGWHTARMTSWQRDPLPLVTFNSDADAGELTRDGKWLVGIGANGSLQLVDTKQWKTRSTDPVVTSDDLSTTRLVLSPDSQLVACIKADTITLWRLSDQGLEKHLELHQQYPSNLRFSPNGSRLAAKGDYISHAIHVWDTATGKELARLTHPDDPGEFEFSADGSLLATKCDDKKVRVWQLATRSKGSDAGTDTAAKGNVPSASSVAVVECAGSFDHLSDLLFASDGKRLCVLDDHKLVILDVATGKEIERNKGEGQGFGRGPADSSLLIERVADGEFRLFKYGTDPAKALPLKLGPEHESGEISANGDYLLLLNTSSECRLLNIATGQTLAPAFKIPFQAKRLQVSCDGARVYACSRDGEVTAYETATGKRLTALPAVASAVLAIPDATHEKDPSPERVIAPGAGYEPSVWLGITPKHRLVQCTDQQRGVWHWVDLPGGIPVADVAWSSPIEAFVLCEQTLVRLVVKDGQIVVSSEQPTPIPKRFVREERLPYGSVDKRTVVLGAPPPKPEPKPSKADTDRPKPITVETIVTWTNLANGNGGVWVIGGTTKSAAQSAVPVICHSTRLAENDAKATILAVKPLSAAPNGALLVRAATAYSYDIAEDTGDLALLEPRSNEARVILGTASDAQHKLAIPFKHLSSSAVDPSQTLLAMGAKDGAWQVWQLLPKLELLFSYRGATQADDALDDEADGSNPSATYPVQALSFSGDGSILALGTQLGVQLWQVVTNPAERKPPSDSLEELQRHLDLTITGYQVFRTQPSDKQFARFRELPLPPEPLLGFAEAWNALTNDERTLALSHTTELIDGELTEVLPVIDLGRHTTVPMDGDLTSLDLEFNRWAASHLEQEQAFVQEALARGRMLPAILSRAPFDAGSLSPDQVIAMVDALPQALRLWTLDQRVRSATVHWPPADKFTFYQHMVTARDQHWQQSPKRKDNAFTGDERKLLLADLQRAQELHDQLIAAKAKEQKPDEGQPGPLAMPKLADIPLLAGTPEGDQWLLDHDASVDDLLAWVRQLRDIAIKENQPGITRTAILERGHKLAQRAEQLSPDNNRAIYWQGHLDIAGENWDSAIANYARAIVILTTTTDERASFMANQAYCYYTRRDPGRNFGKAFSLISEALKLSPDDTDTLKKHADYAPLTLAGYEASIADYEKLIKLDASIESHYTKLASCLLALNRRDEAETVLASIPGAEKKEWNRLYTLAEFWRYGRSGADTKHAVQLITQAATKLPAKTDPEYAKALIKVHGRWSRILLDLYDFAAANTHLDIALASNGTDSLCIGWKGEYLRKIGDHSAAEEQFKATAAIKTDWWFQLEYAHLLETQERYSEAEALLDKNQWEDSSVMHEKISFLSRRQRYPEALQLAQDIQKRAHPETGSPASKAREAETLWAMGKTAEAVRLLTSVLDQQLDHEKTPNPKASYLALLQARLGQFDSAFENLERNNDRWPDSVGSYLSAAYYHGWKSVGGWGGTAAASPKEIDLSLIALGQAIARNFRDPYILKTDADFIPALRERSEFKTLLTALDAKPGTQERRAGLQQFFRALLPLVVGESKDSRAVREEFRMAAKKDFTF